MNELWNNVDRFFNDRLLLPDDTLDQALANAEDAGLPAINVAPNQGKLLHLLALTLSAQRILEIGTLAGYSTIWLARALPPEGRLITLERDPKHAEVARKNLDHAGVADRVEVRVGAALDLLPPLAKEHPEPFDLVFIDADKQNIPGYFDWALKLTRPGGLILVDNVVRGGAVADLSTDKPDIQGVQRLADAIKNNPRVTATAIQTVGAKGYDGFILAVVNTTG